MKTLISFFVVVMLLFAGCAKDEMFFNHQNESELKKANVPIPMKADMCAVQDMTSELMLKPIPGIDPTDPGSYVTRRMIISGNGTHIGKVNMDKSYYDIDVFDLLIENGIPYFYQTGTGNIVAANGDSFQYNWWAKASLPDLNYIGGIELQSGTGKFKGCSGTLGMYGKIDESTLQNCWTVDGLMQFK